LVSRPHHFTVALPLIVQLETAPQALDALAGSAHIQRQAGQLEPALMLKPYLILPQKWLNKSHSFN
jgi:hypothetical protein